MRPHRRIRKLVKWGGAGLLVLTAAAWTVSMFGALHIRTYPRTKAGWSWGIGLARGAVRTDLVWYLPRPTGLATQRTSRVLPSRQVRRQAS